MIFLCTSPRNMMFLKFTLTNFTLEHNKVLNKWCHSQNQSFQKLSTTIFNKILNSNLDKYYQSISKISYKLEWKAISKPNLKINKSSFGFMLTELSIVWNLIKCSDLKMITKSNLTSKCITILLIILNYQI